MPGDRLFRTVDLFGKDRRCLETDEGSDDEDQGHAKARTEDGGRLERGQVDAFRSATGDQNGDIEKEQDDDFRHHADAEDRTEKAMLR